MYVWQNGRCLVKYSLLLFSVPYRDCAELLNAGIRNTGVHTIVDKNWELPVYCDQDYMGGGKRDFMRTHCEPTFHHNRFKIPLTIYFISVACKPLTTRSVHKRKMADPRICLGFFCISGNSFQPKRRPLLSWELADNISPILTTI